MKKLAAFLALIILVMSVCTVGIGETETPENRGSRKPFLNSIDIFRSSTFIS